MSPGKLSQIYGRLKAALGLKAGSGRAASANDSTDFGIRPIYESFREILNTNDSILQLIADIEDRLSGRTPFSVNVMSNRIRRAVMDVFAMVRNLDRLSHGGYGDLYESLRRINADIESDLSTGARSVTGPLILPMFSLRREHAFLVGPKMANLGHIRNILRFDVPEGFAITTTAFQRFMSEGNLWEQAMRLEELLEVYGPRVAGEACRNVQQAILSTPVPAELEDAILGAFRELSQGRKILVAMRSSAVGEDQAASHAGLYYTELNVSENLLLESYLWVVASSFGLGAVMYRLKNGLTADDALMAAGCLNMVEPRASGVMFTRSYSDPGGDNIVIEASPGLSEGITGGYNSAYDVVVSEGKIPEIDSPFLTRGDLGLLTGAARRLEKEFGGPQDIEWAIDKDDRLFILQCRNMIALKPAQVQVPNIRFSADPLLEGGATACPGIGAGMVFQVHIDDDLERFPDHGVLVAPHSSPKFSVVMSRCAAIVTDQGSPIGHMAILSREYGIPAVVGMKNATTRLEAGRSVTVDASACRVYDGLMLTVSERIVETAPLVDSPAAKKLRKYAKYVTPLNLYDSASPSFKPANCHTLHDITRFIHEKVFEVMFHLGDKAPVETPQTSLLEGNLPYDVHILDVGGGLAEGINKERRIPIQAVLSIPMRAFLEGMSDPRIVWDKPRTVSARGFASVLGESIIGPPAEAKGVGKMSFAIISDRYLNFSTKAGYHFNTVDTYCGKSLNKNYIHFRFEGGAASEIRRMRRIKFVKTVLEALDFKVQCRGDLLVARLEKYDRDFISSRLIDLGRLTMVCRQLDMLMDNDRSPDYFAQSFLKGEMEKF